MSVFLELKTSYDTNGDHELTFFNDKEIQIGGKTVFYQEWFAQGVYSICDILDSSGMYLNFADFCRKFSVKCYFLIHVQVLSAIPKRLLERARDSFRVSLGVRTCEVFLCFVAIVRVRAVGFSLFYVTGEFHRFLHRGRALFSATIQFLLQGIPLFTCHRRC